MGISMRWTIKIALFAACFFAAARFCKVQTGNFTLQRITSGLTPRPEWDVASLPFQEQAHIKEILNQPYSYLGKGAQCFVFASQDGQYVIKFFRHDHISPRRWLQMLPFDWARSKAAKKSKKLYKDFASYKLAYESFKDETGLIFLHLNKTGDFGQTLDLVDKLGIHHRLPLDQYEFLLQKKASLAYPAIEEMMKLGNVEQARQALTNLVLLLAKRAQKGIADKDPDLNTNFGFIGITPIQIDMGRYRPAPPKFDRDEIIRITDNLHQWLMVRYPDLDRHLKTQIENL
jgi:hypothetical protein